MHWNHFPFQAFSPQTHIFYSVQCYNDHTITILLLLTLNESKKKAITTVQSSILGCWAKGELEFYWQATYKKPEYMHQNTEMQSQMPKLFLNAQCGIYYTHCSI